MPVLCTQNQLVSALFNEPNHRLGRYEITWTGEQLVEYRIALPACHVHIGTAQYEQRHNVHVVLPGGEQQGKSLVRVLEIHIGTVVDQGETGLRVTGGAGIEQGGSLHLIGHVDGDVQRLDQVGDQLLDL